MYIFSFLLTRPIRKMSAAASRIAELSKTARQKEDFVSNFAHGGLKSDEDYASKSYDSDQISIIVERKSETSGFYGFLSFSLTAD